MTGLISILHTKKKDILRERERERERDRERERERDRERQTVRDGQTFIMRVSALYPTHNCTWTCLSN